MEFFKGKKKMVVAADNYSAVVIQPSYNFQWFGYSAIYLYPVLELGQTGYGVLE
ncbi:MAG TPA: hypothetical protein PLO04_01200 [Syntrophorhabdaceae bacterium]|nr:hypothetical protein [Syntrophorhabdaceae bacterium]